MLLQLLVAAMYFTLTEDSEIVFCFFGYKIITILVIIELRFSD